MNVTVYRWALRVVVKAEFSWVVSRANMLYLAAHTHKRAAACLHEAHIAASWEFWTEWLPTEIPFLAQNLDPGSKRRSWGQGPRRWLHTERPRARVRGAHPRADFLVNRNQLAHS